MFEVVIKHVWMCYILDGNDWRKILLTFPQSFFCTNMHACVQILLLSSWHHLKLTQLFTCGCVFEFFYIIYDENENNLSAG